MGNKKEENRKWIMAQIEETAHTSLLRLASEKGVHVAELTEEIITTHLVNAGKHSKSKTAQIYAAVLEDRERQSRVLMIKQLILSYQAAPSEELLDQIKSMCDVAGLSMEKMVDDLNEMPHMAEVVKGNDSISKAEMWLIENMKPDKPIAARSIEEMGLKAGFKKHTLNDARQRINQSGKVQITSTKQGAQWFWALGVLQSSTEHSQ